MGGKGSKEQKNNDLSGFLIKGEWIQKKENNKWQNTWLKRSNSTLEYSKSPSNKALGVIKSEDVLNIVKEDSLLEFGIKTKTGTHHFKAKTEEHKDRWLQGLNYLTSSQEKSTSTLSSSATHQKSTSTLSSSATHPPIPSCNPEKAREEKEESEDSSEPVSSESETEEERQKQVESLRAKYNNVQVDVRASTLISHGKRQQERNERLQD